MKVSMHIFSAFFVAFLVFVPLVGYAGEGLVPCGRDGQGACTICHFAVLADNVIDFLTGLLFIVAMTILVIAGIIYIVSAGNSTYISLAKTAIKSALIGAALVLLAWVLITWGINTAAKDGGLLKMYKVEGGAWDYTCNP